MQQVRTVILAGTLLSSSAQVAVAQGITFGVPAGWAAQKAIDGTITYTPKDVPAGETVMIRVLPPVKKPADLNTWFQAHLQSVSRDLSNPEFHPLDMTLNEGERVLSRAISGYVGKRQIVRLVVVSYRDNHSQMLPMQYVASSADLINKYLPAMNGFLTTVKFPVAPVTQTKPVPKPTPSSSVTTETAKPVPTTTPPVPVVFKFTQKAGMNALQFKKTGHDPQNELIPDQFRCYQETESEDFRKPGLFLNILPGNQYRLFNEKQEYGKGKFTHQKGQYSGTYPVWQSDPLAGGKDYSSYMYLDETGQRLKINVSNHGNSDVFWCYQRGPREELVRMELSLKTPKPGSYPCTSEEGKSLAALQLLPGNKYRLNGQEGQYTLDLLSKQNDSFSSLNFTSGPLTKSYGSYSEDPSGQRFLFLNRYGKCSAVAKPTLIPAYGTEKAPPPPAGSGGLNGAFARFDSSRLETYFFQKNGYVYTRMPKHGLEDVDCSRTLPNGLPVCETYTLKNGQLKIGNNQAEPLSSKQNGVLMIGRETFEPLKPVTGLKLQGQYESIRNDSFFANTTAFSASTINFTLDGKFKAQNVTSVSSATTDTGQPSGNVVSSAYAGGASTNQGTYRFVDNSVEFRYSNGTVKRQFAFKIEEIIFLGGNPYLNLTK